MALMTLAKAQDIQLSRFFKSREFDCPCVHCNKTLIETQLISQLDIMRDRSGIPIHVNSGYRCPWYQADLKARGYDTAKGISQHELGAAADIHMNGMLGKDIEQLARMAGFMAVGTGHAWAHLDLRSDKERSWSYAS